MDNVLGGLLIGAMLVIGLFAGAAIFSTETEIEVPGPVEYKDKIVDKIVEVPGDCEVCAVSVNDKLQMAVDAFMKAIADEEYEAGNNVDALMCSGDEYDSDEISVSKTYDKWNVAYDKDKTTVTFEVKLKYDEDDERSCRDRYDVEVVFEEGEDTLVTIL